MKKFYLLVLSAFALSLGCAKEEEPPAVVEEPPVVEEVRIEIKEGESYDEVISKLGEPNVESNTEKSRVLIYDQMEIEIQDGKVVKVFDHRAED